MSESLQQHFLRKKVNIMTGNALFGRPELSKLAVFSDQFLLGEARIGELFVATAKQKRKKEAASIGPTWPEKLRF